jgi:hypothetical protein
VGPLSRTQRAWLDAELSRTTAAVKIVFGHLPNHPFAVHREVEILNDPALEEILRRHDVDAYVSGHHHAYYPGAVEGVRHVAMPCLGSGARRLIGEGHASSPALLVLTIDDTGIVALDAFPAPTFDAPIPREALPFHIVRDHHDVIRDDLAGLEPVPPADYASLYGWTTTSAVSASP